MLNSQLLTALQDGRTVLVASRRAARAVLLAYAQHARRAGRRAWRTPEVLTVPVWLERAYRRGSFEQRQRLLPTSHVAALWDQVVAESPHARSFVSPLAAARLAHRAWARAVTWGVSLEAVASDPSEEAQVFSEWAGSFADRCASWGWLPIAGVVRALHEQRTPSGDRLWLAQPDELTPVERALFSSLQSGGDDVQLACSENVQPLAQTCAARDGEDELRRAAEWAREQLASGALSVGVVIPDLSNQLPAVRRAFEDTFAPGVRRIGSVAVQPAFEVAAARSLQQFPIVRAAFDLLELAGGHFPVALVSRVLRSPFPAGAQSESHSRALLDVRLRSQGREHHDLAQLERFATSAGCPTLAARCAAARVIADEPSARAPPSRWAERLIALLNAFGWPGDRPLDSDERQTVEKLRDGFGTFGALDEILGRMSYDRARGECVRLISDVRFEPRTVPAPVTVIDPETVVGMRFDALWIAGMNALRWPPPADPDPFLPVALQAAAGMPWATAAGSRMHARRRFDALLTSAPRIVASWHQWDGDAEQLPSPWLANWPALPPRRPLRRAFRETLYAARPRLDTIVESGAPPLVGRRAAGGARVIELQATCPFRAQAELRLHARPLDLPGPDVDPFERGQLAHATLDDLWRQWGTQQALLECDASEVEALVRATVQRHAQRLLQDATGHRARLVAIEVALACSRVLELLALERRRIPFRVHERPELRETLELGSLELDLRIDRVDVLESGELVVIDYKTGASANSRNWYGERPQQPQLPLYALIYRASVAAVAFAMLAGGRVGFEGVARTAGLLPGVDGWPANARAAPAVDWNGLLKHWHANLEALARAHAQGIATVDPLPQACRRCHLALLCRVHESGRRVAEGLDDETQ